MRPAPHGRSPHRAGAAQLTVSIERQLGQPVRPQLQIRHVRALLARMENTTASLRASRTVVVLWRKRLGRGPGDQFI